MEWAARFKRAAAELAEQLAQRGQNEDESSPGSSSSKPMEIEATEVQQRVEETDLKQVVEPLPYPYTHSLGMDEQYSKSW